MRKKIVRKVMDDLLNIKIEADKTNLFRINTCSKNAVELLMLLKVDKLHHG